MNEKRSSLRCKGTVAPFIYLFFLLRKSFIRNFAHKTLLTQIWKNLGSRNLGHPLLACRFISLTDRPQNLLFVLSLPTDYYILVLLFHLLALRSFLYLKSVCSLVVFIFYRNRQVNGLHYS